MNQNDCPDEFTISHFSRCHCTRGSITCQDSHINSIAKIFKKNSMINANITVQNIKIAIVDSDQFIPANLLAEYKVQNEILLKGVKKENQKIEIDPEAFRSSRNDTSIVEFNSFDLTGVKFSFLIGFQNLKHLSFLHISNIQSANWTTLPTLPSLKHLYIKYSTGLEHWFEFPNLKYGFSELYLIGNSMTDIVMSRTLEWVLKNSADTLLILDIEGNAITKVPLQIGSFQNIEDIYLDQNPFPPIIRSGTFDLIFSRLLSVTFFSLDSADIEDIEPEVFEG